MQKYKIAVISVSGGMDSTGLLLRLLSQGYVVYALSFYYGQKHSIQLQKIQENIKYLQMNPNNCVSWKKIDLSSAMGLFNSALIRKDLDIPQGHYQQQNMKLTVVPNRNAIFSSIIYGYALSIITNEEKDHADYIDICLGVHAGDHLIYKDCTPDFYVKIYEAFKQGNWQGDKVQYYLPYINEDKTYILKDALLSCEVLNIDFDTIFKNTITCYNPAKDGRSCGKCGSCTQRLQAFKNIERTDPIPY